MEDKVSMTTSNLFVIGSLTPFPKRFGKEDEELILTPESQYFTPAQGQ